jgi:hypothetical protein
MHKLVSRSVQLLHTKQQKNYLSRVLNVGHKSHESQVSDKRYAGYKARHTKRKQMWVLKSN